MSDRRVKYSKEVKEYIQNNYKGVGPKEMAQRLNDIFGIDTTQSKMNSYYGNHHLNSGLTGRFEKGSVPANKGKKITEYMDEDTVKKVRKTAFKKGIKPHNTLPIGAVVEMKDHYLWVKVKDIQKPKNKRVNWIPLHQMVYEFFNGPVPEGYLVYFKNKDIRDFSKENLGLMTRSENMIMNRFGRMSEFGEVTEAYLALTRLERAMKDKSNVDH